MLYAYPVERPTISPCTLLGEARSWGRRGSVFAAATTAAAAAAAAATTTAATTEIARCRRAIYTIENAQQSWRECKRVERIGTS